MITLRRHQDRQYQRRREEEAWSTFHSRDQPDTLAESFGSLAHLKEGRLAPRSSVQQPHQDAEIITYVREGTLAYEDSLGQSGVIRAGEFQRMTTGPGIRYSESNASPSTWVHVFQIWLHPLAEIQLEPGHEQRRFSTAERRGGLCVVASPDGRGNSLRIHQDALLHSAILNRGQHVAHALVRDRSAWLHIVQGEVLLAGVPLSTGDGAGITEELSVSLTASAETEILLLDLAEARSSLLPVPSAA